MFRTFFSAAALVSVVAAGLSFPARTQACPMPMPNTLLWLYQNSSEVHLATYSRSVDVGIEADDEGHSQVSVRRFFDISSTLKGESKKSFAVDQFDYRSKRTANFSTDGEPRPDVEETDEADETDIEEEPVEGSAEEALDEGWMQPGSPVLLFLREEGDEDEEDAEVSSEEKGEKPELVLTNQRDGVRWIASNDIGIYEARIKELNSIYGGDTKDRDHQLIEWMIRCMEHPSTRWDGAHELYSSFESLDRVEAAAEHESDDENRPWVAESDGEEANYARLLTHSQMDRISNILMSPGGTSSKGSFSGIMDGEGTLINLVERWAGPDVAKFLLQRLRDGRLESYETHRLMTAISTILGDEDLETAAESYGDMLWEDDEEIYIDEADEEEGEATEETTVTEENEDTKHSPVQDDGEAADEGEDKKPQRTVLEVRSERLAAFIAIADSVLAKPEVQVEIAVKAQAAGRYK